MLLRPSCDELLAAELETCVRVLKTFDGMELRNAMAGGSIVLRHTCLLNIRQSRSEYSIATATAQPAYDFVLLTPPSAAGRAYNQYE